MDEKEQLEATLEDIKRLIQELKAFEMAVEGRDTVARSYMESIVDDTISGLAVMRWDCERRLRRLDNPSISKRTIVTQDDTP